MKDTIILGIIFAISLFILISSFGAYRMFAGKYELSPNPHMQELAKEYDAFFQKEIRRSGIPGAAIVIVQDTSIYLIKGYGKRRYDKKDPVDVHTVFRLGSVSKGFASVLAGTFVEDGDLEWDSKVQDYVPEFGLRDRRQAANMSMQHLLSQTTGISYHAYTNLIEEGLTIDEIMPRFKKAKLAGREGEVYSYQNAIYSVVGHMLEKESGKDFNRLIHERLFSPLGMKNASVTHEGIAQNPNHARPHSGRRVKRLNTKYYNAVPAGGVNASITDMGHWLQLLLGNRPEVLGKETLDEIFTPRINSKNKRKYFSNWRDVKEAHYGMGWRVVERRRDTIVYHGGYVNNFKAEIALNPKDKVAICVLSNTGSTGGAIPTFLKMYEKKREDILNWSPFGEVRKEEEPVL